MEQLLDNPVHHALITNNAPLAHGTDKVRFFDEQVSPFVGFDLSYEKGFDDLYQLLPPGRRILHATTKPMHTPAGWSLMVVVRGFQFVLDATKDPGRHSMEPVPLHSEHAAEMVQLAALTKPGPFNLRTIAFGNYFGFFDSGRLVAMTGQRLHPSHFAEISAVCTHPDHLGKGYAAALMQHQVRLMRERGHIPFLHVRGDNARAIALYERLGFSVRGPMNFYFLKRGVEKYVVAYFLTSTAKS